MYSEKNDEYKFKIRVLRAVDFALICLILLIIYYIATSGITALISIFVIVPVIPLLFVWHLDIKNTLIIFALKSYVLLVFLFLIIIIVIITGMFLYEITNAKSYQYFIIALYIVLIKDIITIPMKWRSRGGKIVDFFYKLTDNLQLLLDLTSYSSNIFILIVLTYIIFNETMFPLFYNLGQLAFIFMVCILAYIYTKIDIKKDKITKTIDEWEIKKKIKKS